MFFRNLSGQRNSYSGQYGMWTLSGVFCIHSLEKVDSFFFFCEDPDFRMEYDGIDLIMCAVTIMFYIYCRIGIIDTSAYFQN